MKRPDRNLPHLPRRPWRIKDNGKSFEVIDANERTFAVIPYSTSVGIDFSGPRYYDKRRALYTAQTIARLSRNDMLFPEEWGR